MVIHKIRTALLLVTLLIGLPVYAENSLEQTQTLQIYTNFKSILGKPSWLLIIRDVDTGLVSPYLFDIQKNDNFWVAFSYGHNYRITASTLQFEGCGEIKNFCNLENGIISGKSMYMTLSGVLSPDPLTLRCNVMKYGDTKFTIVKKNTNPTINE
jgi:hypothetical protein